MLPDQEAKVQFASFYPLEQDRLNECTLDKVQNRTVDKRFSELNLNTTEYEVQHDSGVLDILKAKPLSEYYFPDQFKGKHATIY